jgi:hypothetical protein
MSVRLGLGGLGECVRERMTRRMIAPLVPLCYN